MQILFQIDLTGDSAEDVLSGFWSSQPADDAVRTFAEELVRGVCCRRDVLDRWISASAQKWKIERMAVVDRNVLRLAVHELLDEAQAPPAVVIDEAIEVAKRFGGGDSGGFINGILDTIRERIASGNGVPPGGRAAG